MKIKLIPVAVIVFTIGIFLFFYRNLEIGSMWSFSDLLPFNNEKRIDLFFGTWDSNMLGYPFISSSTPVILLLMGLVIKNDIIVQNIYYLSFIPLSFVSMYVLSRKLISGSYGRYFASFLYALNPITVGEFYNGSVWMNIYVLSPLIILFAIDFLESKKVNIFFGLTISIMLGLIYSTIWIFVWTILFPIFVIALLMLIKELRHKNRDFSKRIIYLFIFILLGILLLLPSIDYILFTQEKAFSQDSIQSFFGDVRNNYQDAIPEYILRMAGNQGSPMDRFGYNDYNWWTYFGYIIPIFVIFSLLDRKFKKNVYYLSFLIIILITTIFMYLTHLKWTYTIYENISFLFSLRNPKYIMYPFSLAISLFFGAGIQNYLNTVISTKKKILILSIILMSLIIYLYPIWNGDMGLNNKVTYTVPQYYYDTFDYLNNDTENYFRILWLPYTYTMQTRLENSIDHVGVKLGQDLFSSPSYNKIENVFLSIENGQYKNFAKKIGFYNVKYVIIDKNFLIDMQKEFSRNFSGDISMHYAYKTPFIHGSPDNFTEFFNSTDDFEKMYEDQNVIIYKNNYFIPYIFILNDSKEINSNVSDKNVILNPDFSNSTDHWKIWNVKNGSVETSKDYINISNPDSKNAILITQEFNATAFNKYKLSFSINSSSNYTHAKIAWYDQDEDLSEKNAISYSIAKNFIYADGMKEYEETFIPPKDTVRGVLFLVSGRTTTDAPAYSNFTNISVVEIDQDELLLNYNISDIIPVEDFDKTYNKITFNIKAEKNSTLVFSESYNKDWNAYVNNKNLTHFKFMDWSNAFQFKETQDGTVTIIYEPQKNRDIIIFIWISTWIAVIIWMAHLIYEKARKH